MKNQYKLVQVRAWKTFSVKGQTVNITAIDNTYKNDHWLFMDNEI